MDQQTKICKYCKRENFVENKKCLHCGRYFPTDTDPPDQPRTSPPVKRPDPVLQVEHIKLIPAISLLISLFLPWLSWFVVRIPAFKIAGFFNLSARMAGRSTVSMTFIQACVYLIPLGCAIFIFRSLTGRTIKGAGIFTGALPLLIFLLVMTQPTVVLRMLSFGFILAVLSGIAMASISLKEEM